MTWQWVVLILGVLVWLLALTYLNNKRAQVDRTMRMMDENNVLLKMYVQQREEHL